MSLKPNWKSYDDEFAYTPEIEKNIGQIMDKVERESDIATKSGSQGKEEYYRLFESNAAARKDFRWANQEELKAHRIGKILHMNEFLSKLKSAGINAWYSDKGGMAKTLGLYVKHEGLLSRCSHERNSPHYVGFVQVPFMQEYEELFFDQYNVPLGPKRRGWRTVLLRLIEQDIITEVEAHRIFGEPQTGAVSRRYREYLQYIRNRPN